MMTRSQNSKSSCYTIMKTLIQMSFKRYLNIFSLIYITMSFLMVITDAASANAPAENSQILPHTVRMDPNSVHRLDLFRAEISSPKGEEEESKNKLRRMIEQVRSIQFETEVEVIEVPDVNEEVPVPEPNEIVSDVPSRKTEETKKTEIEQPKNGITDQTLTLLKNSLQFPEKVKDPLELGEILFTSGNTKDAVLFYREALTRTNPNDVRLSQDRAWILFQMGNCLRSHEPPEAIEIYRQLLLEYPGSLWSDLAKVQREFLDWRLKERPHELIVEPGNHGNQRNRH